MLMLGFPAFPTQYFSKVGHFAFVNARNSKHEHEKKVNLKVNLEVNLKVNLKSKLTFSPVFAPPLMSD